MARKYYSFQTGNVKDRVMKNRTRNRYSVKHLGKVIGQEGRAE